MNTTSMFGSRLKRLRQERGLTQDALAELVGCATQTIRKIEGGQRKPSYAIAAKLADTLGIASADRAAFIGASRDDVPPAVEAVVEDQDQAGVPAPLLETPRCNLPTPLTRLIGREQDVERIRQLLGEPATRLLTLTGAGGSGKTRLAIEAASGLEGLFDDGVVFVDLAVVHDATLVVATIADALGIGEQGGMARLERLKGGLRSRRVLLVLDNFEQVVAAAGAIAELLAACPGVKVLATSRETLRVRGEYVYGVPPLAVPPAQAGSSREQLAPAVQLFLERASALRSDFDVDAADTAAIAEICRRLDGLPLAIELAAARSALFTPGAMVARLEQRLRLLTGGPRDMPERQQTLRATIAWSFDLLSPGEKQLLRRIAVFVGRRTLEAVEAVCNRPDPLAIDCVEGLASLVDKSLLLRHEAGGMPSFSMLETIREYALDELERSGEADAVRRAHADYYLDLSGRAQPHLWGGAQALHLDMLEQEHGNVRAALACYLAEPATSGEALQLAGRLWRFWDVRGHWSEGQQWLEQALTRRAGVPLEHQWLTLHGAGNLATNLGQYERAGAHYEASLAITRHLEHEQGIANSMLNLAVIAQYQGDLQLAIARQEAALAIHRDVHNRIGIALSLHNLAEMHEEIGQYTRAAAYAEQSLTLYRELRDCRGVAWTQHILALVALHDGAFEQAERLLAECEATYRTLGARNDLTWAWHDQGRLADARGNTQQAEALLRQSLSLALELGDRRRQARVLGDMARLAWRQGQLEQAIALASQCLALQHELGHAPAVAATQTMLQQLQAECERRRLVATPAPMRLSVPSHGTSLTSIYTPTAWAVAAIAAP